MHDHPRLQREPGWLGHLAGTLAGTPDDAAPPPPPRRLWPVLAGALLLVLLGGVVALVGLGLALDVFSLRSWAARHGRALGALIQAARVPLLGSEAHLLEGILAGVGLCLIAAGLGAGLVSLPRPRLASAGARLMRLTLSLALGALILLLLATAAVAPLVATGELPGLWPAAGAIRRFVAWLLRLPPWR